MIQKRERPRRGDAKGGFFWGVTPQNTPTCRVQAAAGKGGERKRRDKAGGAWCGGNSCLEWLALMWAKSLSIG